MSELSEEELDQYILKASINIADLHQNITEYNEQKQFSHLLNLLKDQLAENLRMMKDLLRNPYEKNNTILIRRALERF